MERLIVCDCGEFVMWEEGFPTFVAPEHFQAEQCFIAPSAPELATALQAALELVASRFDGSGTNGLIALAPLLVWYDPPAFIARVPCAKPDSRLNY
jgi:hypothetical protein